MSSSATSSPTDERLSATAGRGADAELLYEIKDLTIALTDAPTPLVDKLSLSIHAGEVVALVGESGSGKSLTAAAMMGLLPYSMLRASKGSLQWQGQQLWQAAEADYAALRGDAFSMIFQEPMSALNPLHAIGDQIAESARQRRALNRQQGLSAAARMLSQMGFNDAPSYLKRLPHELSGGQRQRVMLAMALINDPQLLIADEPTTALDVTVQAAILDLLIEQQQQRNLAMLFISHDLPLVAQLADRVLVMQNGKVVEQAASAKLFSSPQHTYTQTLLERPHMPERPSVSNEELLRARAVSVRFKQAGWFQRNKDVVAVDNVDLSLNIGETLGIVGESGSGKSTLANALLKLVSYSGEVTFAGQAMSQCQGLALRQLRADMQVVMQDPMAALSPRLRVMDVIAEGLVVHQPQLSRAVIEQRVISIMQQVGLAEDSRYRYPHEFSGGQRQRIAIARAMIVNPRLLILDEPTAALDMAVQHQVLALLNALQVERGLSFIIISHDLDIIKGMADRVLVMNAGSIVEQGPCEDLFAKPKQPYTQSLLAAATYRVDKRIRVEDNDSVHEIQRPQL